MPAGGIVGCIPDRAFIRDQPPHRYDRGIQSDGGAHDAIGRGAGGGRAWACTELVLSRVEGLSRSVGVDVVDDVAVEDTAFGVEGTAVGVAAGGMGVAEGAAVITPSPLSSP